MVEEQHHLDIGVHQNTTDLQFDDGDFPAASNYQSISKNELADRLKGAYSQGYDLDEVPRSFYAAEDTSTILLIDIRTMFKFNESHVRTSINLSDCALVKKRLKDGKMQVREYLESRICFDGTQDIVIYDDDGLATEVTEFVRLIYDSLSKIKSEKMKLQILLGGFDSFKDEYPEYCTNGVPFVPRFMFGSGCEAEDETGFLNWEATAITDRIYLGALHDAKDDALLQRLGITHVLNCSKTTSRDTTTENPNYPVKYLELDCADDLKQSLETKLEPAFKFIREVNDSPDENTKVLVHCYAGISRSAAIVIAFLMLISGRSYEQCYNEVKSKRKIIAPNINFVAQLMKFEEKIKQDREVKPVEPEKKCSLVSKRKKFNLACIKLPAARPAVRYDDIASAPIMPTNYNPFAEAFRKAASESGSPPKSCLEGISE